MVKLTTILLSLALTTSIMLPSVLTLLEHTTEVALNCDIADEENTKEEKKESNEKDIFFHYSSTLTGNEWVHQQLPLNQHLEQDYIFQNEIHLPPPEYRI